MEKYKFSTEQQALMESLRQPFAVYQFLNKRVVTLVLSDGFCDLFGYEDRTQAYFDMDNDMYKDTHPDDVVRIANDALHFATDGEIYDVIYRSRDKNSINYRIIHAIGKHVYTEDGIRLAHVWYTDEGFYSENSEASDNTFNRILNNVLHEESILREIQYDQLTGLPSMSYFFDLAQLGKNSIISEGENAVLLYIDLNGMKYFNSSHSFSEGDKLLRAFGRLLASTFSNENCCHIGADHFAVFTKESGLEETLQHLFSECKKINNGNSLTVRVGIYSSRMGDVPVSLACDRAKLVCNTLRKSFESCYAYFSPEMKNNIENRQYFLSNIDKAISEKWIKIHYQPIIRTVTGKVCDEEALARWADPVRGFLAPCDFIPFLEEGGQIYKLDLYVLDQVLEKINQQKKIGLPIVPHSINLSRTDFDACDMVEEIRHRVDAAGVDHSRITIELTESIIGNDFNFMKEQVERFRSIGFQVWLDDFGSGYSSLDVLQSIKFDLIKFDMNFMRRLDENSSGRIILADLMKMATNLGVETVCEGVETESQKLFLQEIGCSKLQGYYFLKSISADEIFERYEKGIQIGFENPDESDYYDMIGRVSLYDLSILEKDTELAQQNFYSTLPMCMLEIDGDKVVYVRYNNSYQDFVKKFFDINFSSQNIGVAQTLAKFGPIFEKNIKQCSENKKRILFDEQVSDGSIIHILAQWLGVNPVTGKIAVAIAVLSITEPVEGASYSEIARTLAADYYNIYVVDLDTDRYIEYTSPVGEDDLVLERHGNDFFESAKSDADIRIYEEDREMFLSWFSKDNVIKELNEHGVFTTTYRLIDNGTPLYVNMKTSRMQSGSNRIILGISIIDSQMKQKEEYEKRQKERDTLARLMALTDGYLVFYSVDPATENYVVYSSSEDYDSFGLDEEGTNFFTKSRIEAQRKVYPEDRAIFLERFTKERILQDIQEKGSFSLQYRLLIHDMPKRVSLRVAPYQDGSTEKLVVSVRVWKERK